MLSRTADNLYWLGRYVERADILARILDAAYRLAAMPASYGGEPTSGNRRSPPPVRAERSTRASREATDAR